MPLLDISFHVNLMSVIKHLLCGTNDLTLSQSCVYSILRSNPFKQLLLFALPQS